MVVWHCEQLTRLALCAPVSAIGDGRMVERRAEPAGREAVTGRAGRREVSRHVVRVLGAHVVGVMAAVAGRLDRGVRRGRVTLGAVHQVGAVHARQRDRRRRVVDGRARPVGHHLVARRAVGAVARRRVVRVAGGHVVRVVAAVAGLLDRRVRHGRVTLGAGHEVGAVRPGERHGRGRVTERRTGPPGHQGVAGGTVRGEVPRHVVGILGANVIGVMAPVAGLLDRGVRRRGVALRAGDEVRAVHAGQRDRRRGVVDAGTRPVGHHLVAGGAVGAVARGRVARVAGGHVLRVVAAVAGLLDRGVRHGRMTLGAGHQVRSCAPR